MQYATANGTALANTAYTATSGTLTFAPGTTTEVITVAVLGQPTPQPDETFLVNLSNPVNTELVSDHATGTIINQTGDQASIELELFKPDGVTPLPAGTPLTLNQPFVLEAIVKDLQTTPTGIFQAFANVTYSSSQASITGPITYGPDFQNPTNKPANTSTPGVITRAGGFGSFPPADPTAPELLFSVPMIASGYGPADFTPEADTTAGDELFEYGALSPAPVPPAAIDFIGTSTDVGTNVFVVGSASTTVGTGSTNAPLVFTVTRFTPDNDTATVFYSTSDGTAKAGQAYTAESGTLTFLPGVMTMNVTVPVIPTNIAEPAETMSITLSNPTNAVASASPGIGTINNSNSSVGISVADATAKAGQSLSFVVTLSSVSGFTVDVHYATVDGTAKSGVAYQAASGTLTFAPGVTQETVTVNTFADTQVEPDETFQLALSSPVNGTLTRASAQGLIKNVPPAEITGYAYVDLNNDGIKESNETGIAGVTVTVTQPGTSFSQSTLTGTDRSYAFIGLAPAPTRSAKPSPASIPRARLRTMALSAPCRTSSRASCCKPAPWSATTTLPNWDCGRNSWLSFTIATHCFPRRKKPASSDPRSPQTARSTCRRATPGSRSTEAGKACAVIEALFQSGAGTATMTLYDNNLNPIASSSPSSTGAQLQYNGTTGAAYFLKISGTNPSVTLLVEESLSISSVSRERGQHGHHQFRVHRVAQRRGIATRDRALFHRGQHGHGRRGQLRGPRRYAHFRPRRAVGIRHRHGQQQHDQSGQRSVLRQLVVSYQRHPGYRQRRRHDPRQQRCPEPGRGQHVDAEQQHDPEHPAAGPEHAAGADQAGEPHQLVCIVRRGHSVRDNGGRHKDGLAKRNRRRRGRQRRLGRRLSDRIAPLPPPSACKTPRQAEGAVNAQIAAPGRIASRTTMLFFAKTADRANSPGRCLVELLE